MPKYIVDLPLVGEASVKVEADSEDEAIEKALDEFMFTGSLDIENGDVLSLEPMKYVCRDNVFYGPINIASAEEIEDEEE